MQPKHDCSTEKEIDLSVISEDGKLKVLIIPYINDCFLNQVLSIKYFFIAVSVNQLL